MAVGGNDGGEFYIPQSVAKLLVEMIEPYRGTDLSTGRSARTPPARLVPGPVPVARRTSCSVHTLTTALRRAGSV